MHAIAFACLATLGLVLKTLVGEKHLLASRENKFRPAFGALQDLIVIFHTLLRDRVGEGSGRSKPATGEAVPSITAFPADVFTQCNYNCSVG